MNKPEPGYILVGSDIELIFKPLKLVSKIILCFICNRLPSILIVENQIYRFLTESEPVEPKPEPDFA